MSLPAQKPIGFLPIRTQLVSKLSYKLFCSEFVNLADSIPVIFGCESEVNGVQS